MNFVVRRGEERRGEERRGEDIQINSTICEESVVHEHRGGEFVEANIDSFISEVT